MAKAKLADIVAHCNRTLKTDSFEDWPGAVNGLQVENRGSVSRIAAAVDAAPATVKKAAYEGADLLIVRHSYFWGKTHPWTGNRYKLLRLLFDNNIAVYSSHLPLDAHRDLATILELCRAAWHPFAQAVFIERGQAIGLRGELDITGTGLAKAAKATGCEPTVLPGGAARCKKIGVVTGGAGAEMKRRLPTRESTRSSPGRASTGRLRWPRILA